MANINKVILSCNLTQDPEMRKTPKGKDVCVISLAVNRLWKNEAGEKIEEVCFVQIECCGKIARKLSQWLKKGSPILIERQITGGFVDRQSDKRKTAMAGKLWKTQWFKKGSPILS